MKQLLIKGICLLVIPVRSHEQKPEIPMKKAQIGTAILPVTTVESTEFRSYGKSRSRLKVPETYVAHIFNWA